jgi:hypothetical protein
VEDAAEDTMEQYNEARSGDGANCRAAIDL